MTQSTFARKPAIAGQRQMAVRRCAAVGSVVALLLAPAPPAQASAPSLNGPSGATAAGADRAKIGVCHRSGSAKNPFVFMTVGAKSVRAHVAHGDAIASGPADCGGTFHHYVTDTLRVGRTAVEAQSYAFDLDNDANHRLDNSLGAVFATLSNVFSLNAEIATSLQTGDVVILHSLRAVSPDSDPAASWQIYLGHPQPSPVLTGGGSFAIDPAAPTSTKLVGAITSGQFAGGPGTVVLRLGLVSGQPPIEIHLAAARIQADCDADGCSNGKLGGGLSEADVDAVIIPVMASRLQAVIDADPSCRPTLPPESCTGIPRTILNLFDTNGDYQVTADELRANDLITSLLSPDIDLFDASGNPGHDGVRESVSLGLGFTAKSAVFDAAGEH